MRLLGIRGVITLVFAGCLQGGFAAQAPAAPDFNEVYQLLKQHLANTSDAELNRAAVEGLLSKLGSRVVMVDPAKEEASSSEPFITRTNTFDGDTLYLRFSRIDPGVAPATEKVLTTLRKPANWRGVVLDLRYADGRDYPAAAALADLFIKRNAPLLKWQNQVIKATASSADLSVPVAVLVNRETSGPAEAVAAILREAGAGLIIGSSTAGRAAEAREFTLANGRKLRIATAPLQLGDGSELPIKGITPDIAVSVSADDERYYYADAFRALPRADFLSGASLSLTNTVTTNAPRRRINEADLVRDRRQGMRLDGPPEPRSDEPQVPVVNDPALARALDLLKGLAVVRQAR